MKPLIIPIFIFYKGCPHRCIFCNLQKTAGNHNGRITEYSLRETVFSYIANTNKKTEHRQIAFYGGNFTGMDKEYEIELLGFAKSLMNEGLINSIRVSTRPDYIDQEQLDILEVFGVTTVEIGVQSMVDNVLRLSERGHSSDDAIHAMEMLKKRGFEAGVHLMIGLPGDSREGFAYTIDRSIELKPDMVRIHPTIVFENTKLAKAYQEGRYQPLDMSDAIETSKLALRKFSCANIPVIRVGLQTTREIEAAGSVLAGPFHPAFRSLVEESIFLDMASILLAAHQVTGKEVVFSVSPRDLSHIRGQKNMNLQMLKDKFHLTGISILPETELERGTVTMNLNGRIFQTKKWDS